MTYIGLIRHGLTDWNHLGKAQGISDIPLNAEGRMQAAELANRLSNERWDIIATSDLSRATETANIIAAKLGVPITVYDDRLREINCGQIEGTTEAERLVKWGSNWRDLDLGMESFEAVSKRGVDFLAEAALRYKDKRVLAISHGALIGLTLQRLLPDVFTKTYIDNTSITSLKNINSEWTCTLYNCTTHLSCKG